MRTRLQKLQLELPLTLERIRRQILAEIGRIESYVTPNSEPLLRREQFRLRQIDHVIATRASEVVSRLQNLQADYLEKGWLDEANTIAARIREIEDGAADRVAAHDQAEQADAPMLRLVAPSYVAEIKRAYADEPVLRADMLSEIKEAA